MTEKKKNLISAISVGFIFVDAIVLIFGYRGFESFLAFLVVQVFVLLLIVGFYDERKFDSLVGHIKEILKITFPRKK